MTLTIEQEMTTALKEQDRFEALALIDLKTDQLIFLQTAESASPSLKPALEEFLLRAVTNLESLDELEEGQDVTYYDLDERQITLNLIKTKSARYLFTAVILPHKTYKQVMKRLVKTIKSQLPR